jgi:hypothetical protein
MCCCAARQDCAPHVDACAPRTNVNQCGTHVDHVHHAVLSNAHVRCATLEQPLSAVPVFGSDAAAAPVCGLLLTITLFLVLFLVIIAIILYYYYHHHIYVCIYIQLMIYTTHMSCTTHVACTHT